MSRPLAFIFMFTLVLILSEKSFSQQMLACSILVEDSSVKLLGLPNSSYGEFGLGKEKVVVVRSCSFSQKKTSFGWTTVWDCDQSILEIKFIHKQLMQTRVCPEIQDDIYIAQSKKKLNQNGNDQRRVQSKNSQSKESFRGYSSRDEEPSQVDSRAQQNNLDRGYNSEGLPYPAETYPQAR